MRIQYASDLHIEFLENMEYLKRNPLKLVGDILVLAGDIVPFTVMHKYDDFFNYISDNFEQTYWIPGNHEYYYYDIENRSGSFHEMIRSNVHLLNNTVINREGIDIIFSTLWTNIPPLKHWEIENGMNDFRVIKYKGNRFTAMNYNYFHNESYEFLKQALIGETNRKVVVSHHMPTFMNYPDKYKGSVLSDAFAVELYDLIKSTKPDVWIYGHTHDNTNDFRIDKTHIRTNQLGYIKYDDLPNFRNDLIVSV